MYVPNRIPSFGELAGQKIYINSELVSNSANSILQTLEKYEIDSTKFSVFWDTF